MAWLAIAAGSRSGMLLMPAAARGHAYAAPTWPGPTGHGIMPVAMVCAYHHCCLMAIDSTGIYMHSLRLRGSTQGHGIHPRLGPRHRRDCKLSYTYNDNPVLTG